MLRRRCVVVEGNRFEGSDMFLHHLGTNGLGDFGSTFGSDGREMPMKIVFIHLPEGKHSPVLP
jgi:hypothetical protein